MSAYAGLTISLRRPLIKQNPPVVILGRRALLKRGTSVSKAAIELIPDGIRAAERFSVVRQLRPHLAKADFVERVAAPRRQGYQLLAAMFGGRPVVAGFRGTESLAWGRFVYVEDLVTDESHRSLVRGGLLFDRLVNYCRDNGLA